MSPQGCVHNSGTAESNSFPFRVKAAPAMPLSLEAGNEITPRPSFSAEEKGPADGDDSLEQAGRDEQEYLRRRLRDELGREPSEEEVNEWLRRHTEGY
jgi:hypothetical protein